VNGLEARDGQSGQLQRSAPSVNYSQSDQNIMGRNRILGDFLEGDPTADLRLDSALILRRGADMTYLENYRTHYCPDSGFSLISENDAEFEVCNCFRVAVERPLVATFAESEAELSRSSTLLAEQTWYRTIAALAKVCGIGRAVQAEPVPEHNSEEALSAVRKL
jgi:hypothetical protein